MKNKVILKAFLIFILLFELNIFSNTSHIDFMISKIYLNLVIAYRNTPMYQSWSENVDVFGRDAPSLGVIDSFFVNAYASQNLISKSIRINYGFLNLMENEDELAAVIAHELCHFIREKESETRIDQCAIFLAYRADYNPFSLLDILERIFENPDFKDEQSNGHGALKDRIEFLKGFLKQEYKRKANKDPRKYKVAISAIYADKDLGDKKLAKEIDDLKYSCDSQSCISYLKDSFIDKQIRIDNLLNLLANISDLIISNPELDFFKEYYDIYELNFLGGKLILESPSWLEYQDILKAKLYNLFLEVNQTLISLIPGISNAIDLYEFVTGKSFFTGEKLDDTARLLSAISLITPGRFTLILPKTIKNNIVDNIADLGKKAEKILQKSENIIGYIKKSKWGKVFESGINPADLLGSERLKKILNQMRKDKNIPKDWNVTRTTKHEKKGLSFHKPNVKKADEVRIMPGDPNSPYPISQKPYVRWKKGGKYLDKDGVPTIDDNKTHLSLDEFKFIP